jgi:hypothetical protein
MKHEKIKLIGRRIAEAAAGLAVLYIVFQVFIMMSEKQDKLRLNSFLSRKTLEEACDNLVIAPSNHDEASLRDGVFATILDTYPQFSLTINKIKDSGQFTAQNRWDLCREVGKAEQTAAKVKQTLGLEKPPFG